MDEHAFVGVYIFWLVAIPEYVGPWLNSAVNWVTGIFQYIGLPGVTNFFHDMTLGITEGWLLWLTALIFTSDTLSIANS